MPAETGAAETNAYNTATALATTEAARLAIKVLKATSGVFSLAPVFALPARLIGS